MGKLMDYVKMSEEVERLVMEKGYSISNAIEIVKEKATKDTDQSNPK